MADVEDLAQQIVGLFKQSVQGMYARFTPQDRSDLEEYGKKIASLAVERRETTDPVRQRQLEAEITGFTGAINFIADRYMLAAAHDAEKAAVAALKIAAEWGLKVLVAAII